MLASVCLKFWMERSVSLALSPHTHATLAPCIEVPLTIESWDRQVRDGPLNVLCPAVTKSLVPSAGVYFSQLCY